MTRVKTEMATSMYDQIDNTKIFNKSNECLMNVVLMAGGHLNGRI
jgi:hypothetical protein